MARRNSTSLLSSPSGGRFWTRIIWSIFDIARRILEHVPVQSSKALIEGLADTANSLLENHVMRSHDLTGAVFQRTIIDRKFLAANYTDARVSSAADRNGAHTGADTSKQYVGRPDNVKALHIADFACGVGPVLVQVGYQTDRAIAELAGGDSEALHADMMAE